MNDLYALKDKLCEELKTYGRKDLSKSSLAEIDTLAHACKNVCKIIEDCEMSGGYSSGHSYGYSEYSMRRDPREDFVRPDGSYRDGGMSYARGRTGRVARDSMGRYSKDDEIAHKLREMMNSVSDENTRRELSRIIDMM